LFRLKRSAAVFRAARDQPQTIQVLTRPAMSSCCGWSSTQPCSVQDKTRTVLFCFVSWFLCGYLLREHAMLPPTSNWHPRIDFVTLQNMNPDIRWKQRFENYEKALRLLREALADVESLSELEKEGTVQRFEFTVELAWKTLKDYLEFSGVVLDQNTPKSIIKQAFAAKIISDGQLWIDILDCRNRMSHTYDEAAFDQAVREMARRFLRGFDELYDFFKQRSAS
jgi:nucleotidyltransferase substrate binding protein (TIGR01987 family)